MISLSHALQQFHFLRPACLLLLLPIFIALLLFKTRPNLVSNWDQVCDAHLLKHLLTSPSQQDRSWFYLWCLLGILGILALAGPSWRYTLIPTYQINVPRVILLDQSNNMLATDIQPSRAIRAKYKVLDLLKQSKENQVGMLAYAGESYIVSPLTSDEKTIENMVGELSPSIMPIDGNNLAQALQQAGNLLQQANFNRGQIIIFSASPAPVEALDVAKTLASKGYSIYALGMGSNQQTPLVDKTGAYVHDKQGNIIFSEFNPSSLQQLTQLAHGQYIEFSNDNTDINSLLAQLNHSTQLANRKKTHLETQQWQDEGRWLLLLMLPLLLYLFSPTIKQKVIT